MSLVLPEASTVASGEFREFTTLCNLLPPNESENQSENRLNISLALILTLC